MSKEVLHDLEPILPGIRVPLADAAALVPDAPPKDELERELDALRTDIAHMQEAFYADGRHALLVVLQGRDTSGKDGTIQHVFQAVNPLGLAITGFKRPTPEELSHDFLWRVHRAVPPLGMIGIFNRSHYEDVLVVRVHGLVPRDEWERRYEQINAFERHLAESRVVVLKFYLHISREEQRGRLRERLDDPEKNWKFNPGDLAERGLWDDYTAAYEAALSRCSTEVAPWFVVPSDRKVVRNVLIARKVLATLRTIDPKFPPADPEVLRLRDTIL